jgi:L-ascorbate metabolism protein UlaG (beta-lactamase superfamily)
LKPVLNEIPSLAFTYVGGPTAIIEFDGLRLMTDPTLDPAGGVYPVAPLISLEKTIGPALGLNEIGSIDLVLLTHDQHADNLDHLGRELIQNVPRTLTTVVGAKRLMGSVEGLATWQTVRVRTPGGNTIRITATPARHGPVLIERLAGDVIGFVLTWEERNLDLLYVTGDTVWFDGVAEVARRFSPKSILLFGGAAQTRGPFYLTMNTNDALETAEAFPGSVIIPVHCEGWAHFTQGAEELAATFSAAGLRERLKLFEPCKKIEIALQL